MSDCPHTKRVLSGDADIQWWCPLCEMHVNVTEAVRGYAYSRGRIDLAKDILVEWDAILTLYPKFREWAGL